MITARPAIRGYFLNFQSIENKSRYFNQVSKKNPSDHCNDKHHL